MNGDNLSCDDLQLQHEHRDLFSTLGLQGWINAAGRYSLNDAVLLMHEPKAQVPGCAHSAGLACLDCFPKNTSHVKDPLPHEHNNITLQSLHAKLGQVWLESNGCPVITGFAVSNLWFSLLAHVIAEDLQHAVQFMQSHFGHWAATGAIPCCLTCLYLRPLWPSQVSTANSVEKMFVNLAPNPFLPPVTYIAQAAASTMCTCYVTNLHLHHSSAVPFVLHHCSWS